MTVLFPNFICFKNNIKSKDEYLGIKETSIIQIEPLADYYKKLIEKVESSLSVNNVNFESERKISIKQLESESENKVCIVDFIINVII